MKQKKPSFHFTMVTVALIFLATPNINLIDLIPDFIGYLLLMYSLSFAADAFPYFAEAKAGFTRLMWISLAKIPAAFIMLMMWNQDSAQRSIVTVFSISFAVLDLVFLVPTLSTYLEGFFYLGDRYGCESALRVPNTFGSLTREGFKKLTLGFFIAKEVMSTLPELTLVSVKQYGDYVFEGSSILWNEFYPLFAVLGAVLILGFGIVWLTYALRYFSHLDKAGEVNLLIESHFSESHDRLYEKRKYLRIATGLLLLILAVGLSIDFVIDDMNILPDAISIAIFIIGVEMLRPMLKVNARVSSILFGLYGICSIYANTIKASFVNQYQYSQIARIPAAASLYTKYTVVYAIETALACIAVASLIGILKELFVNYAPKTFESNTKKLYRRLYTFTGLGWLSAIASLLYVMSMRYTKPIETAVENVISSLTFPKWEWFWMVPFALALAWIAYSITFIGQLRDTIKDKAEW